MVLFLPPCGVGGWKSRSVGPFAVVILLQGFWRDSFTLRIFQHTPGTYPGPQPTVYEGIPFIWGFGDAWGMLQGYVGVLLESQESKQDATLGCQEV